MAFSRSVFAVLLLCVACRASVPVFMWGNVPAPILKSNPLTKTTTPAFSDILSEELSEDPFTVVFIEETLSIEDFSRRNDVGKTSFPYLHENLRKSVYLPSVENAVAAFYLIESPEKVDLVTMTQDGLSNVPDTDKFLFINLKDARDSESRAEMLLRHNDFMKDMVTKLQKEHGNVVAVYTGKESSWTNRHRVRRQASSNSDTNEYVLDGLRLYAKNIRLVDGDKTIALHGLTNSTSEINSTALTLKTTMNFDSNSIVLNFKGKGGYWFFDTVTLSAGTPNEEDLHPIEAVYALDDFAYRCAQNVSFINGNSSRHLFFEDLKVQPVFHTTNESSPVVFGDSFNCVGFFSAPIWSGLFVVFILLSITFYGIMMMMDIRTMDRFDDPKGKTITISAE